MKRIWGPGALLRRWSKIRFMIVKMVVICGLWTWIKLLLKWFDSIPFPALSLSLWTWSLLWSFMCFHKLYLSSVHLFCLYLFSIRLPFPHFVLPSCYCSCSGFVMRTHWSAQAQLHCFLSHCVWSLAISLLRLPIFSAILFPHALLSIFSQPTKASMLMRQI